MPNKLRVQLERDEGLRLTPYRDSVGKLTIGYGRNLDDRGITADEAAIMLSSDIARCAKEVATALPWITKLSEPRWAVLVNMTHNMGIGSAERGTGLLGFRKMLTALEAGDYDRAAEEMLDSKWVLQVGDRAGRLARQMKDDRWIMEDTT